MSERQFACLSLTVISTIANYLAATCIDGWGDYYYGVAKAATLTSYMFQILVEVIRLLRSRHPCYPDVREVSPIAAVSHRTPDGHKKALTQDGGILYNMLSK